MYTEIMFPEKDIRFIAINDGVDSDQDDGDFTPFRNIINEWYAKDTSKKIRAVFRNKGMSGKRLSTLAPYGYQKGENGILVVDEETAPVVKLIYELCAGGNGPGQIARILRERKINTPRTTDFLRTGRADRYDPNVPWGWTSATVAAILSKKEYMGHTVNFKTTKKSFKSKKIIHNPEEKQMVFENTHEAIISSELWEVVQNIRAQRHRPMRTGETAVFSGILFCADCGSHLGVHRSRAYNGCLQRNYVCSKYRNCRGVAGCTTHYIREDVLVSLVLEDLRNVIAYARDYETKFVQQLTKNASAERIKAQTAAKRQLEQHTRRISEIDTIIQRLYEDKSHLSYWFDFVSADESDVQCINEQQCREYHTEFEKKALFQRRNFVSHGVNLRLSGLSEDSGRKIAINLIKEGLKDLIKKKKLIESKHLLCERLACYQRKVKAIRGLDNLFEMQVIVDKMVNDAFEKSPCLAGYTLNGVDLFALRDLLHYLNQSNTVLSECILPGPDMPTPASGSCFTWDFYSKEQKEKRITLFFYYHEISYLSMAEFNFPILKRHFQRYSDAPYQVVVEVDYNEEADPHDFTSEPSIQYHYIASPTKDIPMPIVCQTREKKFSSYDQIMRNVQESYLKQGRIANRLMTTQTGFTFTTTSKRTGELDPLSDYVYKSIKESLEDIFGSM